MCLEFCTCLWALPLSAMTFLWHLWRRYLKLCEFLSPVAVRTSANCVYVDQRRLEMRDFRIHHVCRSLSEDVAGATFMAAGSSAPELFSSIVAISSPAASEVLLPLFLLYFLMDTVYLAGSFESIGLQCRQKPKCFACDSVSEPVSFRGA